MLQVEWNDQDLPVFAKNEKHPLECDAVVLDELSMVDILLFENVLRAMPLGCRLILVGGLRSASVRGGWECFGRPYPLPGIPCGAIE